MTIPLINPVTVPAFRGTRSLEFPKEMRGRGIVIVGGGKFLPSGFLAIKQLRSTGCTLPIEFWHLGPLEFPAKLLPLFLELNATPVDAFAMREKFPMKQIGGWECKPYAVAYSNFEEVLFIDADNLTLKDPTFLFHEPLYCSNTALFWPDFLVQEDSFWRIKPQAFELLGIKPQPNLEIESGQLLINKRKCWEALMTCVAMNEASDFFYQHCTYGDKDTFTLSFLLTNTPYGRISHLPTLVRDFVRTQYTPQGVPLFEHGRKWVLPVEANRVLGPTPHDKNCFEWLTSFSKAMYA